LSKVIEIFHNLEGVWEFQRKVSDEGVAKGKAIFRKTAYPMELHYREESEFTGLKGELFKTFEEHKYCYENGTISVYFLDPPHKLLHTLIFSDSTTSYPISAHAKHLCNCDTYVANYLFQNSSTFVLNYAITSAGKIHHIETHFEKQT
jgi:hypothetical protein